MRMQHTRSTRRGRSDGFLATTLRGLQPPASVAPDRCTDAPVPRSPAGASVPATIAGPDPGRTGHSHSARSSVRFGLRRDAASRGLSGRRPRTFERTSIPTAVGRGRSRSRVTSRATMSDRPRAGARPAGIIARRIRNRRSPPGTAGGDRFVVCGGTAGDRRRSRCGGGSAGPVHRHFRSSRSRMLLCPSAWSWGNRESAASRPRKDAVARQPSGARGYTRCLGPRSGGSTGEVLRSRDQGASSVPRGGRGSGRTDAVPPAATRGRFATRSRAERPGTS
jgi:hypothetical protein